MYTRILVSGVYWCRAYAKENEYMGEGDALMVTPRANHSPRIFVGRCIQLLVRPSRAVYGVTETGVQLDFNCIAIECVYLREPWQMYDTNISSIHAVHSIAVK